MGIGSSFNGRGVKPNTHLHPEPRPRMHRAISPVLICLHDMLN